MSRLFVLFFFLNVSISWAQLSSTEQVSKEVNSASADEIKKQLLFEAATKAVERFAPEMGYGHEDFTKNLNASFEEHFKKFKGKVFQQKFGSTYLQTMSEEQKNAFSKELDNRRDEEFIKFSRVVDVVQNYTFKSFSQVQEGQQWQASIDLTLDRVKLGRLLRNVIENDPKQFSRLWIFLEVSLKNLSWKDLNLTEESAFVGPLADAWKTWWSDNLPKNVEDAEVCSTECSEFLEQWQERPKAEAIKAVDTGYTGGVWLKISIELGRPSTDDSRFQWSGRAILLDIGTKRTLGSFTLPAEQFLISKSATQGLGSQVASHMYKSPLLSFGQLHKHLNKSLRLNKAATILVQGQRHTGDVLALMDLLKTRGSYLGLEASLEAFQKEQARFICFYRGEEKSFNDLLSRLKELKSSQSYVLMNEFTGVSHVMKLMTE